MPEEITDRCQNVSDSPWGLAQCVLPLGHDERHLYSPSEALEDQLNPGGDDR